MVERKEEDKTEANKWKRGRGEKEREKEKKAVWNPLFTL